MRIAVDVMSGERGVEEIVKGALGAVNEYDINVILVGNKDIIEGILKRKVYNRAKVEIYPANEVITMKEQPTIAIKRKKDASVLVAAKLVKEGIADAFVSPGNTGATFAAAFMNLGRLKGVARPALLTPLPTQTEGKFTALLDIGANPECKPIHLTQFAVMGAAYAHTIWKIEKPKIGLLSNGEEESKGIELTKKTHSILRKLPINYVGYIEGRDLFNNSVDVAVCDGFVGNLLLKTIEGVGMTVYSLLKEGIKSKFFYTLGALMIYPVFKMLKRRIDYSEYGGAPLLGINGISIVTHGNSSAKEIKNGIRVAAELIKTNINDIIVYRLKEYGINKFNWFNWE